MKRIPSLACLLAALFLVPTALAAEDPQGEARLLDGARLYLGGAGGRMGNTEVGGGAVIGYQLITGRGRHTATWFGVEVLGVEAGPGFVPLLTGDFGLKLVAFPQSFVRPYFTANLGVTMLLFLPLPSLAAGLGAAVPLGAMQVDVGLHYRRVFNVFDVSRPLDIGTLQLGLGF